MPEATPRQHQLAVLATPVPPTKQAKYRKSRGKPPEGPPESPDPDRYAKVRALMNRTPAPPAPIEVMMRDAGVPASLAFQLSQRCITVSQAQHALRHWTGECLLTGLTLAEQPAMLQPVERPDGTFVCRAVHELQSDLSDAMLVQLCGRVVATAQHRAAVSDAGHPITQRPQQPQRAKEVPHVEVPGVELRDQGERVEEHHRPGDRGGPAGAWHGERGGVGQSLEDFLQWAEGGTVPA